MLTVQVYIRVMPYSLKASIHSGSQPLQPRQRRASDKVLERRKFRDHIGCLASFGDDTVYSIAWRELLSIGRDAVVGKDDGIKGIDASEEIARK